MAKKRKQPRNYTVESLDVSKAVSTILPSSQPAEQESPPDRAEVSHMEKKLGELPSHLAKGAKAAAKLAHQPVSENTSRPNSGLDSEKANVPADQKSPAGESVTPAAAKAIKPVEPQGQGGALNEGLNLGPLPIKMEVSSPAGEIHTKPRPAVKVLEQGNLFRQHNVRLLDTDKPRDGLDSESSAQSAPQPPVQKQRTDGQKFQRPHAAVRGGSFEQGGAKELSDQSVSHEDSPDTAGVDIEKEPEGEAVLHQSGQRDNGIITAQKTEPLPLAKKADTLSEKGPSDWAEPREIRTKPARGEIRTRESLKSLGGDKPFRGIDREAKLVKDAPKTAETVEQVEGVAASAKEAAGGAANAAVTAVERVSDETQKALREFAGEGRNPTGNDHSGVLKSSQLISALITLATVIFPLFFAALFGILFISSMFSAATNQNLSDKVLAWTPQISAACQKYGIPEYSPLVSAIMMQESGGDTDLVNGDLMECAEGMGLPVGTPVEPEQSIDFGVKLISQLLAKAQVSSPADLDHLKLAIQAYNFGSGYIDYALTKDGKYTHENAEDFARRQAAALGWSSYGDVDYVDHVLRYYSVSIGTGMGAASPLFSSLSYPMEGYSWITYSGHEGIDLPCNVGTPVYASSSGTVWYTKDNWTLLDGINGMMSYGNCVCITHDGGLETRYAHLSSCLVSPGQTVLQGQLIGYSGNTGNTTGPHLHFSVYLNGSHGGTGESNYAALAFRAYRQP